MIRTSSLDDQILLRTDVLLSRCVEESPHCDITQACKDLRSHPGSIAIGTNPHRHTTFQELSLGFLRLIAIRN
jgi:hypothetical protein